MLLELLILANVGDSIMSSVGLDIDSFTQAINKCREDVHELRVAFHRFIAMETYATIAKYTPVLDGYLRNSWNFSYGEKDEVTTRDRTDDVMTGSPLTADEIERAVTTLQVFGYSDSGEIIWLNNAQPYVCIIEYTGYSRDKAPAGMARIGVLAIAAWGDKLRSEFIQKHGGLGRTE